VRRITTLITGVGLAAALVGCGASSPAVTPLAADNAGSTTTTPTSTSPTPTTGRAAVLGPEEIPLQTGHLLATAVTTPPGTAVDSILCQSLEQLAYRRYVHLQVYVDGVARTLPAAIGLVDPVLAQTQSGPLYGARQCYYWLHTETTDGIIQVESPTPRAYTLGDFFDLWGQQLSSTDVADARGPVTATVDGRLWRKTPRAIPLTEHAVIQLAVGRPLAPFRTVDWSRSQL
jgi:hypothetical protein